MLARFVGIDDYQDAGTRDLTGAVRDATAMWALFSDTVPSIDARLLANGAATAEAIRRALDDTLGAATPEDTVIVSFSGHGSRDNRLVAYDYDPRRRAETTIPMEEIAERFKRSRAKIALCVLDCCFSGGAPARVLEDSPVSRGPGDPLGAFAGKGRFLLAACKIDEEAWETPGGKGHGLLTDALLGVLRDAEGPVDLQAAVGRVMERVRAEAGRMGVEQTPVLVGEVEGGLMLPALRAGERFFDAFPERRGVRVGKGIDGLATFGIPQSVLAEWAARFPGGLNDLQLEAVNEHRVLDGRPLLVVAPTSSGKTFIGEMAAARAITEGRKAAFLLPYRALVNEKYEQFAELYGERTGMRVVRCTGDYLDQTEAFVRGKYDLALLTYEMFLNLAVGNPSLMNQLGLVVVDEAQFVADPNRGISLELLLTHLLAARERGIEPQLIALSTVIGGINDFETWLGTDKLITHERPVPLVEGVLDRGGTYQFMDSSGRVQTEQLLPPGVVVVRRDKPGAQDVIVPLVRKLVGDGEKAIVFRNRRGPAQGCAGYLARDLGLPAASGEISELPNLDLSAASADLKACLAGGTAFHNTNLSRDEKLVVERAFRDPRSNVRVLAATTTVAAGINTPASTVILAEQEFVGEDGRPFTVAEYKNMAGRAGRLGFNEEGKAIILAGTEHERKALFSRYVMGKLEEMKSSFDPGHLETWVLRLLAQIDRVPRRDVVRLLANTYGGYLATRRRPEWRFDMEARLEALMDRMLGLDLLEVEGDDVRLTLLGRAFGGSALSFESNMRLVELLQRVRPEELTAERLIAIVQALPESDGGYTPMMRRGQRETVRPREASLRYGPEPIRLLQQHARDAFDYYARCKRAAILWDWVAGVPTETIEQRYTTTPYQGRIGYGDVRKFADATRFHLRSAHQIASVMLVGQGPDEEAIEGLLKRLEVGIPADALGLLDIPASLSRGEYLALYGVGVRTADELWTLASDTLTQALGAPRASQLEASLPPRSAIPRAGRG